MCWEQIVKIRTRFLKTAEAKGVCGLFLFFLCVWWQNHLHHGLFKACTTWEKQNRCFLRNVFNSQIIFDSRERAPCWLFGRQPKGTLPAHWRAMRESFLASSLSESLKDVWRNVTTHIFTHATPSERVRLLCRSATIGCQAGDVAKFALCGTSTSGALKCVELSSFFFFSRTQWSDRGPYKLLHWLVCPFTMSCFCRSVSHGSNIKQEGNSAALQPRHPPLWLKPTYHSAWPAVHSTHRHMQGFFDLFV